MSSCNIPVIAITGGPCAGKTTVLSYLRQKLADLGITVVVVPEVATEFILSGLKPEVIKGADFQRQILAHMIEKENRWKEVARLMAGDRKVIICDRGALDGAAYSSAEEFDLALKELGCSIVGLRDERYAGVIFLRSLAVDNPSLYTCDNNAARSEGVEAARELDERTLAAWTGHPHLRIIDNGTNLEGKLSRTLQAVCRVLGIPAPLEIERKYLVKQCDLGLLPEPVQRIHIVQYYLDSSNGGVERIRSRGQGSDNTYYHTVKQLVRPGVRTETERLITKDEFDALMRSVDPELGKIEKDRYCFVWRNQYFELDAFKDPPGLTLLEIELGEEGDAITLPDFLKDQVVDVTDDPAFGNNEIARQIMRGDQQR